MPRTKRNTLSLLMLVFGVLAGAWAHVLPAIANEAQVVGTIAPEEAIETVSELANILSESYIYPDVGQRYADYLRIRIAAGAYNRTFSPPELASLLTADVQNIQADAHLRILTNEDWESHRPVNQPSKPWPKSAIPDETKFGIETMQRIGPVAYLRFNAFPDDPQQALAVETFLRANADASAIIIDARAHRGGGLMMMDSLLKFLYSKPTQLLTMQTRPQVDALSPMSEGPTLLRQTEGGEFVTRYHWAFPDLTEKRLQQVPVYYLISGRTASAAEHLALALKITKRATLVGETTRGAGHFGTVLPLGERFGVFVPIGRTFDPATGTDWEAKGVTPDIEVPSDDALDRAFCEVNKCGKE